MKRLLPILLLLILAACSAPRQSAEHARALRAIHADSALRVAVAAIDSPEIIILRPDSPRTLVRVAARRASVQSAQSHVRTDTIIYKETHTDTSAPAPKSTPTLLTILILFNTILSLGTLFRR